MGDSSQHILDRDTTSPRKQLYRKNKRNMAKFAALLMLVIISFIGSTMGAPQRQFGGFNQFGSNAGGFGNVGASNGNAIGTGVGNANLVPMGSESDWVSVVPWPLRWATWLSAREMVSPSTRVANSVSVNSINSVELSTVYN